MNVQGDVDRHPVHHVHDLALRYTLKVKVTHEVSMQGCGILSALQRVSCDIQCHVTSM